MLGIDLISLGKSRVLTVIDMQPLHPTEEYSKKYINHLSSIRSKYEDLQGVLSGKIYDDTSFFSKNMLFGRFTDESKVDTVVGPAFEEYLAEYLKLMANAKPNNNKDAKEVVINRQKEYDIYSAIKDPAVGLFDAYFGKEWSDSYVHDFLFSLSRQREPMELLLATKSEHTDNKAVHSFKIDQTTGEVSIGSNVTNNSNSSH